MHLGTNASTSRCLRLRSLMNNPEQCCIAVVVCCCACLAAAVLWPWVPSLQKDVGWPAQVETFDLVESGKGTTTSSTLSTTTTATSTTSATTKEPSTLPKTTSSLLESIISTTTEVMISKTKTSSSSRSSSSLTSTTSHTATTVTNTTTNTTSVTTTSMTNSTTTTTSHTATSTTTRPVSTTSTAPLFNASELKTFARRILHFPLSFEDDTAGACPAHWACVGHVQTCTLGHADCDAPMLSSGLGAQYLSVGSNSSMGIATSMPFRLALGAHSATFKHSGHGKAPRVSFAVRRQHDGHELCTTTLNSSAEHFKEASCEGLAPHARETVYIQLRAMRQDDGSGRFLFDDIRIKDGAGHTIPMQSAQWPLLGICERRRK